MSGENQLDNPVSMPAVTHSRLYDVTFNFVSNQIEAQVEFGFIENPGAPRERFVKLAERHIEWSQAEVISRLSTEERQALASVKNRILNAGEGLLATNPG